MKLETFASVRLPNQSARIMNSVIEEAGLAWTPLLSKAGIARDIAKASEGVISGAQELRLQEAFVDATRHIPGAWFRMGLQYRLMSYGPLGLAVLTAETFGAGLRRLMSLTALTYSLLQYRLVEDDGEILAIAADDGDVPPACREFSQERALGAVTRILNDMHPFLSPVARIETVLDAGHGRHECEAVLGVPVVFAASSTRWVLKPGVAAVPLPTASPLLEESYAELCTRLVEEARVHDDVVGRLYALLVRAAPHFPDASQASRALALSERTLYRRLRMHGLSFGRMVGQVREQRASDLLTSTRMSVEAIAEAVGFSETASFSRAFRRWKGVSPLRFRQGRT